MAQLGKSLRFVTPLPECESFYESKVNLYVDALFILIFQMLPRNVILLYLYNLFIYYFMLIINIYCVSIFGICFNV